MKLKKNWKIIVICIVIAVTGAAVYARYAKQNDEKVTSYSAEFEEDQEKPESEKQEASVQEGIEIPGYESITIPSGTKDVKVDITNPENNQVYFEVSFYLPDTDEVIYQSKMIKPGQHIYEITLEHEMEAGEYPLTVKYATYSADKNLTPKNGADVNCTLIVQ